MLHILTLDNVHIIEIIEIDGIMKRQLTHIFH